MRISKTIVPVALAALLAACSNEEEIANNSNTVILDEGKVEIKLSTGGSNHNTRAAIESDANGLFEADGLGIYMLATNESGTNSPTTPIVWDATQNEWAVWMDNVEANAVKDAGNTRTQFVWTDGETRWYPIGNWYCYRFYGYYPRVTGTNITNVNNKITVHYDNLDGTKDIIYGRSLGADMNSQTEQYRYSARYFRQDGFGDQYPSISFEHKLMRLQFCVQGLPDPNKEVGHEYDDANTMKVESIKLEAVPASADLIIADLATNSINPNDANDLAGKITFNWSANGATDLYVQTADDGSFDPTLAQVVDDQIIDVGQSIMLPVPDEQATQAGFTGFKVWVNLSNNQGEVFAAEHPMELKLNGNIDFESGKTYRVVLQIAGPREVILRATLQQWDDSDSGQAIYPLIFN